MSPWNWTQRALGNATDFRGRARRREFWWSQVFALLFVFALTLIGAIVGIFFGQPYKGYWLGFYGAYLIVFVPSFSVMVRRLHDADLSGWWSIITFISFLGSIPSLGLLSWAGLLLVPLLCVDSRPANRWGPNPKASDVTPAPKTIVYGR